MATVLLDSNVLIGARIASDHHHETAHAITTAIDGGALPTGRIPDEVLSEVLNHLHTRAGNKVAIETLDAIQASVDLEVDGTTKTDFDAGGRCSDSTRDCRSRTRLSSRTCAARGSTTCIASTTTSDAVGEITRLETPTNPFA